MLYFDNMTREGRLFRGVPGQPIEAILVREPRTAQPGGSPERFSIFIINNTTNDFFNYVLPDSDEQFGLTLYDEKRNETPKTPLGKKLGQRLSLEGQAPSGQFRRNARLFLKGKDAVPAAQFDLFDYFDVKAAGSYKLVFVQRLYRVEANGKIAGVFLPGIEAPVDINAVPLPR